MKSVLFCGDTLTRIQGLPSKARQDVGFQINKLQLGELPDNWKPIKSVGKGVNEIRVKAARSHYRVMYIASLEDAIYVLHVFKKKTRKTRKSDVDLTRKRLRTLSI